MNLVVANAAVFLHLSVAYKHEWRLTRLSSLKRDLFCGECLLFFPPKWNLQTDKCLPSPKILCSLIYFRTSHWCWTKENGIFRSIFFSQKVGLEVDKMTKTLPSCQTEHLVNCVCLQPEKLSIFCIDGLWKPANSNILLWVCTISETLHLIISIWTDEIYWSRQRIVYKYDQIPAVLTIVLQYGLFRVCCGSSRGIRWNIDARPSSDHLGGIRNGEESPLSSLNFSVLLSLKRAAPVIGWAA